MAMPILFIPCLRACRAYQASSFIARAKAAIQWPIGLKARSWRGGQVTTAPTAATARTCKLRPVLRILSTPQNTLNSGATSEIENAKMTDRIAEHRIRMTAAEARALGEAAMRGAGYDDDEAGILTDHVLDAALCGYEYPGLPKLPNVVDARDFQLRRRPVSVLRDTGATAMIDGGNNTGMIAAYRAAEATIKRGKQTASPLFASPTPG
jgi:hypothetical protein